jgi:hypothetical protein
MICGENNKNNRAEARARTYICTYSARDCHVNILVNPSQKVLVFLFVVFLVVIASASTSKTRCKVTADV